VPPTVTHRHLIATARQEIRALRNPGIRPDAWRSITALLTAIAGYLPDPFPSERVLAKKLGRAHQNVHRTLDRARELGLVTTAPRPLEKSYRDGQTYLLVCLSEGLRAAIARHHFQASLDARRKISYSVGDQDEATSSGGGISLPAAPVDQKDNVVPFNRNTDDDWSSPVIGEDPKAPIEGTSVRVDPAVYLARRFDAKWAEAKRTTPALRVSRASSRGMAIGYLRKVMLPEITPEHIEAYFDAFVAAAVAGDVLVKESQFAFERFTGWWGREDVEDPTEHLANRALSDLMREQARQIRGEIG
jgi:hypothetical protein